MCSVANVTFTLEFPRPTAKAPINGKTGNLKYWPNWTVSQLTGR